MVLVKGFVYLAQKHFSSDHVPFAWELREISSFIPVRQAGWQKGSSRGKMEWCWDTQSWRSAGRRVGLPRTGRVQHWLEHLRRAGRMLRSEERDILNC